MLAIEQDPALAAALRARFAACGCITVHESDVLSFRLPKSSYKVFANIPFAITTQIVNKLTGTSSTPMDSYLVVQREAAEWFMGSPRGTLRATLLHPWFEPTIMHSFCRADFTPTPLVEVVMLRLRKRGPPLVHSRDAGRYRDFVASCFTARHPSLRSTLTTLVGRSHARSITKAVGIHARDTPTTLRPEQWPEIFARIQNADPGALAAVRGAERRLRRQQQGLEKVHRTRTLAPARASSLQLGGQHD